MELSLDNDITITFREIKFDNFQCTMGTIKGFREVNEDFYYTDKIDDKNIYILCDGHGGTLLSHSVPNEIFKKLYFIENIDSENLADIYHTIDKYYYNQIYKKNMIREGTTVSMVIIDKTRCILANLGDSNIMLVKDNGYTLCDVHRPNNKNEIVRILDNGYKIIKTKSHFRIDGKLSLSRSIGDYSYKIRKNKFDGKKSVVINTPDCQETTSDFDIIIMASDGLWDYVEIDDVYSYINHNKKTNGKILIEYLIKKAVMAGSIDNISCIIIQNCV